MYFAAPVMSPALVVAVGQARYANGATVLDAHFAALGDGSGCVSSSYRHFHCV